MAYTLCLAPVLSLKATPKPGNLTHQTLLQRHKVGLDFPAARFCCVKTEAAKGDQNAKTKPNSVICSDCDGNGAVLCSQCEGSGVNSVDFFGGRFKAGASCWLCGGRKEMLCGNCNGAGFLGGFMSSFDE